MAKRHFEAVSHRGGGGGFALISSSLTGRVWDGGVWVFSDYNDYSNTNSCNLDMVVTRTDTGISDVLWLSNQTDLLLACDSGELELWSCTSPGHTLSAQAALGCHDDMVLSIRQLAEDQHIVSGGADGKVIVWDLKETKLVNSYRAHCGQTLSVSTNPQSSSSFLSTGQDGLTVLWDTRLPQPASKFPMSSDVVYTSSTWENNNIALGSECGRVEVCDVRGDTVVYASYSPHIRAVRRLTFAPWNSTLLASVSDDCTVAAKLLSENNSMFISRDHKDFVRGASWSANEKVLLTCGWDGQLLRHSLEQLGDLSVQQSPKGSEEVMSCDRSDTQSVSMSSDNPVQSCDSKNKETRPIDMFAETDSQ